MTIILPYKSEAPQSQEYSVSDDRLCILCYRYLVIAWPLWYHVRSTIKISLVVCVVVWTLTLPLLLQYLIISYHPVE